ncbi:hypothetical protein EGR_07582 [Echinococcus granulosus]|uniref:Uncharacterized protein n=1 Tax=Echinococcus granulosus TaxID=6210 RepID=W6UAK9_ECHGR|nr:hypothetical protein EGR_07582 [Echinococcus granulosus]EUB57571.1 hypothetical protein EGR_07582 [Echinococcus granulosus]
MRKGLQTEPMGTDGGCLPYRLADLVHRHCLATCHILFGSNHDSAHSMCVIPDWTKAFAVSHLLPRCHYCRTQATHKVDKIVEDFCSTVNNQNKCRRGWNLFMKCLTKQIFCDQRQKKRILSTNGSNNISRENEKLPEREGRQEGLAEIKGTCHDLLFSALVAAASPLATCADTVANQGAGGGGLVSTACRVFASRDMCKSS